MNLLRIMGSISHGYMDGYLKEKLILVVFLGLELAADKQLIKQE